MATKYVYQKEVSHKGLNKYRIVKASSEYELNQKVSALCSQWNEQWAKKSERETKIKNIEDSATYANDITQQAESAQLALDSILTSSIIPKELDLNIAKDFSSFPEEFPKAPFLRKTRQAPCLSDSKYNQAPSLFTRLSKKKMADHNKATEGQFKYDLSIWENEKASDELKNEAALQKHHIAIEEWESKKVSFLKQQTDSNNKIDELFEKYKHGPAEAVEWYLSLLLNNMPIPFNFDRFFELCYEEDSKILVIDQFLPLIDDLPKLKALNFVKTRNEFKKIFYPDSYVKAKYDSVIYQMVLQTLNYIFDATSKYSLINAVNLNGRIATVDKSTGNAIEPCILTVNVDLAAFQKLNLSAIDPQAWFRSAKGVSAAELANLTPIAPIISIDKEDHRFVEGYAVVKNLDSAVNLAVINWQDFENLIREIFESEFNSNGGEVKITQASRDGGVDAIAFDPDPIRGGKIVIQAKRYTNVVGVSAVRDLYGTVMNEGATKGILVTTSNFGSDAYSFAQGKPLTLMNGANLLYLLEKHGHKARIDLKEAKILQSEARV